MEVSEKKIVWWDSAVKHAQCLIKTIRCFVTKHTYHAALLTDYRSIQVERQLLGFTHNSTTSSYVATPTKTEVAKNYNAQLVKEVNEQKTELQTRKVSTSAVLAYNQLHTFIQHVSCLCLLLVSIVAMTQGKYLFTFFCFCTARATSNR